MANINKVQLSGNLTRDPILRHTAKGVAVAEISLAINRVWQDQDGVKREEVTFVEVKFWRQHAENCGKYLKKGAKVCVEGHLKIESWEDKQTLQKRRNLTVHGENIEFLGPRPTGSEGGTAQAPAAVHEQEEDEQFPL